MQNFLEPYRFDGAWRSAFFRIIVTEFFLSSHALLLRSLAADLWTIMSAVNTRPSTAIILNWVSFRIIF